MKIYNSFTQLVGNTPLLKASNYAAKVGAKAEILTKLECFNPAGSAKDRVALGMILQAEKEGLLNKESVIIEATSGNTGIGLAAVAAARGYKVIIVMPENMSDERKKMMRVYGAELVLTPAKDGMKGATQKAEELAVRYESAFIPNQFCNKANPTAHYETTGPEIWRDTCGEVDIFVAAVGTGGTLTGVGEYLKEKNKDIKIVAVEPEASPLLSRGVAGPHKIQGIGANFVPETLNRNVYDEVITVTDDDAVNTAKEFVKTEGVLVGISSGAALCAATVLAKRPENAGKKIVAVLADTGERYLSTDLAE